MKSRMMWITYICETQRKRFRVLPLFSKFVYFHLEKVCVSNKNETCHTFNMLYIFSSDKETVETCSVSCLEKHSNKCLHLCLSLPCEYWWICWQKHLGTLVADRYVSAPSVVWICISCTTNSKPFQLLLSSLYTFTCPIHT